MRRVSGNLPGSVKGSIIDAEATKKYVFTFGYIIGDRIEILQMENETDKEKEAIRHSILDLELPSPVYAYGKSDEKWIQPRHIDIDLFEKLRYTVENYRPPDSKWCDKHGWYPSWLQHDCGAPQGERPKWPKLREVAPAPSAYLHKGLQVVFPRTPTYEPWWFHEALSQQQTMAKDQKKNSFMTRGEGARSWWIEYLTKKEEMYLHQIAFKNRDDLLGALSLLLWLEGQSCLPIWVMEL
jgi:hypothetical protein